MAVGPWKIYASAKYRMGLTSNGIRLDAGNFRMTLHSAAASANINNLSGMSLYSQVGNEIAASGGYVAGGDTLANISWSTILSSTIKWDFISTGNIFTGTLTAVKYALIRFSLAAGSGRVICFCSLSSADFNIAGGNTLTIKPATTGVFTLV